MIGEEKKGAEVGVGRGIVGVGLEGVGQVCLRRFVLVLLGFEGAESVEEGGGGLGLLREGAAQESLRGGKVIGGGEGAGVGEGLFGLKVIEGLRGEGAEEGDGVRVVEKAGLGEGEVEGGGLVVGVEFVGDGEFGEGLGEDVLGEEDRAEGGVGG